MAIPKKIDWNQIEGEWRAGIKSIRQMANEYNDRNEVSVSFVAITKHFKKLKVERSLAPAIHEKSRKILIEKTVNTPLDYKSEGGKSLTDSQLIDGNSAILADLQLNHRRHVGHNKSIILKLLNELDFQTDNLDLYGQLFELVEEGMKVADGEVITRGQQENIQKLRTFFNKAMSTGGRIDSVKKLTDALREVVLLERKIYGIDVGLGTDDESLESGLAQVKAQELKRLEALPSAAH